MNHDQQHEVKTVTPIVKVDLEGEAVWQLDEDSQTDAFPDLSALLDE